eukprot:8821410-Pyramimonas_sp.AAC.1
MPPGAGKNGSAATASDNRAKDVRPLSAQTPRASIRWSSLKTTKNARVGFVIDVTEPMQSIIPK